LPRYSPRYRSAVGGSSLASLGLRFLPSYPFYRLVTMPDFWRALRSEFDALLTRQLSFVLQDTREEWRRGRCHFSSEYGEFGRCWREGGFDGRFINEFEEVATRGAYARGCRSGVEPVAFWIYCLGKDLLKAREPETRREFIGRLLFKARRRGSGAGPYGPQSQSEPPNQFRP